MKYFILLLAVLASGVYMRIQATDLGKGMYVEGCTDAYRKLAIEGLPDEAILIKKFCEARKKALDEYVKPI